MTQETTQQEPITIQLSLTLEQVNFVLGALGKLPTDTGAWIVRQVIGSQAQSQVDALQSEKGTEEDTTDEASE